MKTNNIDKRTNIELYEAIEGHIDIPRPVVVLATDYPTGNYVPFHRHSRAQLIYASAGVTSVTTDRGVWVVPPFRAVWVPAQTAHQLSATGTLSMRSVFIHPDVAGDLPETCCVVSVPPLLRELILHATTLPRHYPLGGAEERLMTLILDLIKTLDAAPLDLPIPEDSRLKKIQKALVNHPEDNRGLAQWGRKVGASSRTLTRLLRKETGMSFRQWRQQVRILEALRRLGRGEAVTAVAIDLGYDSPSAFIAMFKNALGKTPGQYFKAGD